jgi:hypothetical protein
MRRQSGFNIRIKLSDAQGQEIHQLALRENRSQSATISLLVAQALDARRAAAHQVEQVATLTKILRGEVEAPQ